MKVTDEKFGSANQVKVRWIRTEITRITNIGFNSFSSTDNKAFFQQNRDLLDTV